MLRQITFGTRAQRWVQGGLKLPLPGCTPTGTYTHVAHANWLWVLPFDDHRTIKVTRSNRDTAVEPSDHELLGLVLVQQVWRVHAHLSGAKSAI